MPTTELRKVRIDELEPPELRDTLLGLKDQEMPDGLVEFVRVTVPEKPFRLVNTIVAVPLEPALTWIGGTEVTVKSTILTVTIVWCMTGPLVAVIMTR